LSLSVPCKRRPLHTAHDNTRFMCYELRMRMCLRFMCGCNVSALMPMSLWELPLERGTFLLLYGLQRRGKPLKGMTSGSLRIHHPHRRCGCILTSVIVFHVVPAQELTLRCGFAAHRFHQSCVNSAMVHGADPSDKGGLLMSARRGLIVMVSMAFLYFSGGGGMKVRRSHWRRDAGEPRA
jgi:hypothetical protein